MGNHVLLFRLCAILWAVAHGKTRRYQMGSMALALIVTFVVIWVVDRYGVRVLKPKQYAAILALAALFMSCPLSLVGATASTGKDEVARTALIPFQEKPTRGDGKAYILQTSRVGKFNNDVYESYWIQISSPDGKVERREAPGKTNYEGFKRCDLGTQPNPPVLITYRTKLLYPQMRRWIMWYPSEYQCIAGDFNFIQAIKESHE